MREIRIPLPRWPRNLTGNLIGVAGLAAIAFFVGALLNNFEWTGLIGGLFALGLAIVNGRHAAAEEAVAEPTPIRKPAVVAAKSA